MITENSCTLSLYNARASCKNDVKWIKAIFYGSTLNAAHAVTRKNFLTLITSQPKAKGGQYQMNEERI